MSESDLLRDQVKESTKEIHRYVEDSAIMNSIINGSITKEGYIQYLVDVLSIYRVLENLLSGTYIKNWISGHHLKIQEDLDDLCGEGSECPSASLPCQSYVQYLANLNLSSDQNMARCVAHVYVRVLGDLSGGTILKRKLQERFPIRTYQFNVGLKGKIVTWINLYCADTCAFMSDAHIAFLSYAAILGS